MSGLADDRDDLSFKCVAVPRCAKKRLCARFHNCPSRDDPFPSDDELFAAYWKDQERTNFYAHSPAQIAEGLRNVFMLALATGGRQNGPNDKAQGSAACGASPGATGSAATEER